jgi:two-component system, chemotaxis family, protein-glutamate methylesterase/glutaminase
LVAVAASAGGVEALRRFVAALPAGLDAVVLVCLHIPPAGPSVLPSILSRSGPLPARHPSDGDTLRSGEILVAPPDRHLTVTRDQVRVLPGPRENGHRPSADVMFHSAAASFGAAAAAVVLSGTMDDGAAGLRAVRAVGGLTLVQDPATAAFPGMPQAAIDDDAPDLVGDVADLASRACQWLGTVPARAAGADEVAGNPGNPGSHPRELTPLTCPECGGTLWRHEDYGSELFRCRVGHAFSASSLLLGKNAAVEAALWAAIVALDERAEVSRRIAERLESSGRSERLEHYRRDRAASMAQAHTLRGLVGELVEDTAMTYVEASDADAAS